MWDFLGGPFAFGYDGPSVAEVPVTTSGVLGGIPSVVTVPCAPVGSYIFRELENGFIPIFSSRSNSGIFFRKFLEAGE